MPLAAGVRLGPYVITAPLGAGGMGEVYRARDTRLDRDVAIKVLPAHLSTHPEVRVRFEREARAVSSLNHPHICTLHDIGREGDVDYLVMELVEGENLADRLAKGPLPPGQVLSLGSQIADALDKAHRAGIVHRDLKPGNIMLGKSGAKLMDFGLARAAGLGGAPAGSGTLPGSLTQSPTVAQPLTAQGSLVGTFQYMAPEQLEGMEADARSDIWAFGCVLYEMATGRRAFGGATQASLISSIMKDQPPPIEEIQALSPPGLERLVRSCLAKDPDERIQTAHDVRLHLRWIAEGGSQAGVPAPAIPQRRHSERLAWILLGVAGVVIGGLAVLNFRRVEPEGQLLRFEVQSPAAVQTQDSPRISPDGRTLAYSAVDTTGTSRIWLRPLGALTAQVLPGTEGTGRPFWSPDSRFLAFFSGGKLKKISIAGGPPTVICDAPNGWDGAWGTKGTILFDGRTNDPIMRVAASGGVAAPIVGPDTAGAVTQVGWPEFLPDGEHFFYLANVPEQTLRVGSLDSDEFHDLGPCESQVQFIPPGFLLFSRGGSLVIQRFDARGRKFLGEPMPVAEQVGATVVGQADFRASNNGILVYSNRRTLGGALIEMDRAGNRKRSLPVPPEAWIPALSPDERRVAVRVVDPQTRTRDIWLIDRGREIFTRFTFEKSNENYPIWAPDGKRIAYWSDAPGASGIVVKQLTGSGETESMVALATEVVLRDWSRDGSTIIFDSIVDAGSDIWILPVSGDRKPRLFLNGAFNEFDGKLSPDGRFLAYVSDESGREEVYVQPFPDRSEKWQVSTRGGKDPKWGAGGREIYYLSADGQMMAVPTGGASAFEPGTPQPLFSARVLSLELSRAHYDVTADGQTFIVFVESSERSVPSTTVAVNWMSEMTGK